MPVLHEGSDAANSTATTAQMGVGDYFFGTVGAGGDSDWVEVNLIAGQTYTFGLVGVGALSDSLLDPILRLRDSSGAQIAVNDDGGPGTNSGLTFTAGSSGTFYLDVQSYSATSQPSDYGLSMTTGDRASYDVMMGAGNLIRSHASWAATPETGATVSWSIRDSGAEPSGGNPFVAPSAAQVAAIGSVMDYIAGISGLTFNQVNPSGTSNDATMVFGAYDANDGSGAYAYYPGSTSSTANAGDVWLNNNSGSTTSLPVGSYSHFVLLHEIGHAVGLAHPGDYNATPGVSITYANDAQFIEDSHQYTVMSYFDESNTTTSVGGYPDTFLLFDLLAIQQQYGADMGFHAGDTVYGFNATYGDAYDFTVNTNPLLCIWDGSGTDTIDLSGYAMGQVLSLRAGEFSDVGGYLQNFSIAIGAVIEDAVGGSGNDHITGNGVRNSLSGGEGSDTIFGAAGNDFLYGNQGNDTLFGGSGNDRIKGGGDQDILDGGKGNDTLDGGQGDDSIWGREDNDSIKGSDGDDSLYGNEGTDTIFGGADNDWIHGGDGDDTINGGSGDDTLTGGGGHDVIYGASGVDIVIGGKGRDLIFGNQGNDTLYGGGAEDRIYGGVNHDFIDGGGGADRLYGGDGSDTIKGGAGDDRLEGGTGGDTLNGGGGDDKLFGQGGHDTFIFADNFGVDTIYDFDANDDLEKIDLSGVSAITGLTDLTNDHMSQVGSDVVIDDLAGNQITLLGVDMNDLLDGNDFLF